MPVAVERLPALAFQPCGRILFAEFADLPCAQRAIMQSPCDGIKKLFERCVAFGTLCVVLPFMIQVQQKGPARSKGERRMWIEDAVSGVFGIVGG